MARSTAEFNLFYHECLEASHKANNTTEEYCLQNEIFFEVHVTPNDPEAERIAPVTIKADCVLGADSFAMKRFKSPSQATHKSLLKKAFYIRKRLMEQYKDKDCSVHITWKFGNK